LPPTGFLQQDEPVVEDEVEVEDEDEDDDEDDDEAEGMLKLQNMININFLNTSVSLGVQWLACCRALELNPMCLIGLLTALLKLKCRLFPPFVGVVS